jgi:5'-nucleotidase
MVERRQQMTYDLSQQFVVGSSSSALFDLNEEARIFREEGLQAFINYHREREEVNLSPGSAFPLIKGLLNLNVDPERPKVEVILMSRNHPDVSLRVFNSIGGASLVFLNQRQLSSAFFTPSAPPRPIHSN